jgi:hypothetical protein
LHKGKEKRTLDTFQDENKTEALVLASLAADKHARKMAEHDQRMAELEIKKRRIDLEATGKHLEAEDCRIAAQHQRERERDKHDMDMLRLCLQYQGGGGGSGVVPGLATPAGQFGMEQPEVFPTPDVFGSMGTPGNDGEYYHMYC